MNLIVACFPKSGSTYLTNLLSHVTGYDLRWLMYHTADDSPQTLYEPWIQAIQPINTVTQQHIVATDGNMMLMKKYNFRVVVHVRNIFDALVSLHDHIEKHRQKVLTGHICKTYFEMNLEEKLSYLVSLHGPFYLGLYVSWLEAQREIPVLWTSYEEMLTNQVGTAKRVLQFYSLDFTEEQIQQALPKIDTAKTRFNKGVAGRGELIPAAQRDELRRLAQLHKIPDDAFKLIGL
jgi:hypothetical protein